MSFGYSVSDAIVLVSLAWKTVQNSRKACGEYDELTREASGLHVVLQRLEKELGKPESLINKSRGIYKDELGVLVSGCENVLSTLDKILEKYNGLGGRESRMKKSLQKVRFGNGQMADLEELRGKITYYTSALTLFLNMVSMGSMGRVE